MSRFGAVAGEPVSLLLRGARMVDPATEADGVADLAIHDGRVVDAVDLPPGVIEVD